MTVNIDNHSKRLNLPLPDESNFLQDDCARIRESFNIIDQKAATLDTLGKLEVSQLPDKAVQYTSADLLPEDKLPPSVVLVDTTGKIPASQLPPAGVTNIRDVSSEAAMLALPATPGDVANRLDVGERYVLAGADATRLANWRILPQTAVTSINGETGAVTGYAKLKPITGAVAMALEGVNGPLRLLADASDDYDAVTYKQLKTVQAIGAGGASMSGVMNNFIGAVEWFNGNRLNLPAGYIAADGQLESRTDPKTADLWTAVSKGMFAVNTDAEWLNGPGGRTPKGQFRGRYSSGDGSTTFRVPDLNGAQTDSIQALFLRGSGRGDAGLEIGGVGEVLSSSAPEITGEFSTTTIGGYAAILHQSDGAFELLNQGGAHALAISDGGGTVDRFSRLTFKASKAHEAYGRLSANGIKHADEIRPNSVVGIWIIRANGSFQAANTSFSILTADKTLPTLGTTVQGGTLRSIYQADGKDFAASSMGVKVAIGEEPVFNLTLVDNNGKTYPYQIGGARFAGGPIPLTGIHMTRKESQDKGFLFWNQIIVDSPTANGTELMVSIYPDRICITGIIRVTGNRIDALNWPVYSVTQMLPGKTIIRKPFCPASGLGVVYPLSNVPGATTGMSAGGGYTRPIKALNEWAVFDGIGGQTTTIAINDIIYFD
ncbi:hypothetical protein EX011_21435 [Salmonella enterica]|nr:hypothetical protein [Salmonella enterica]